MEITFNLRISCLFAITDIDEVESRRRLAESGQEGFELFYRADIIEDESVLKSLSIEINRQAEAESSLSLDVHG